MKPAMLYCSPNFKMSLFACFQLRNLVTKLFMKQRLEGLPRVVFGVVDISVGPRGLVSEACRADRPVS